MHVDLIARKDLINPKDRIDFNIQPEVSLSNSLGFCVHINFHNPYPPEFLFQFGIQFLFLYIQVDISLGIYKEISEVKLRERIIKIVNENPDGVCQSDIASKLHLDDWEPFMRICDELALEGKIKELGTRGGKMKIEERIDEEIRGGKDEWWKRHSRKEYIKMAKKLVKRGFTEEEAVNFLYEAFWAAACEFGGDKV